MVFNNDEFGRHVQLLADTLTESVNEWLKDHQDLDPPTRVAVIASAYCGLYLKLMEYAAHRRVPGWELVPGFPALREEEKM